MEMKILNVVKRKYSRVTKLLPSKMKPLLTKDFSECNNRVGIISKKIVDVIIT